MDYHDQPLGLQPPKFLCIPARPLVCFFATLGVIGRIVMLIPAESWEIRVQHIVLLFLNALLLFGAARNNELALKWSQRVVAVCVVLAVLQFLIFPVAYASYAASGLAMNDTIEESMESMENYAGRLLRNDTTKEKMFVRGLIMGYVLEIGGFLAIGMEIFKYTLINRLWIYAKATENIGANVYIAP